MPRKFLEPRTHIEVHLPTNLKTQLDLYCLDPMRGKPDYGKRSALIQQLLRDFFTARITQETHNEPVAGTSADPANLTIGGSADSNA